MEVLIINEVVLFNRYIPLIILVRHALIKCSFFQLLRVARAFSNKRLKLAVKGLAVGEKYNRMQFHFRCLESA